MIRRCCIFAHYDRDNLLDPYVTHYIGALRPFVEKFILVSTSQLSAEDKNILRAMNVETLCRQNTGYDFCSWQMAMQHIDLDEFDELLQVNDSCYAPLFDFAELFARMDRVDCDFWGLTRSFQFSPHLQSYFVCYRKRVLKSPAFSEFWRTVTPIAGKAELVLHYEVGLSRVLRRNRLKMAAYFHLSASDYIRSLPRNLWCKIKITRNLNPLKYLRALFLSNPTFYHVKEMLNARVPVIKVGLLADGLARVPPLDLRSVKGIDCYTLELIRQHQLRIASASRIDRWVPAGSGDMRP